MRDVLQDPGIATFARINWYMTRHLSIIFPLPFSDCFVRNQLFNPDTIYPTVAESLERSLEVYLEVYYEANDERTHYTRRKLCVSHVHITKPQWTLLMIHEKLLS